MGRDLPLVKGTTDSVPVFSYLALRFTLAAALLWGFVLASPGGFRAARDGLGLGVVLIPAFALQTLGLRSTTATKSAFISLAATGTTDPILRRRAAAEREHIERIATELATRTFIAPWGVEDPHGPESLKSLARGAAGASV